MVIHRKSTPYHPQANGGQAESTDKILCNVLTKIVENSRTDWELKLHLAIWAYHVAFKTTLNTTPFNMVFGLDATLPLDFEFHMHGRSYRARCPTWIQAIT